MTKNFKKGLFASFPIVIAYIPIAITFGITATTLGFNSLEIILMSALIFAGASQFTLIALLPNSFINAIFISIILNLRHLIYSSIIAQKFNITRAKLIAFMLTDEVFATAINSKNCNEQYLLGLEIGSYASWIFGTAIGCFCCKMILDKALYSSLTFSLTALFLLLLIPNLKGFGKLSAIIGGVIALIFQYIGYPSFGILFAGMLAPIIVLGVKSVR